MNGDKRRQEILRVLSAEKEPVNATRLAEKFEVTRQIIVADIALLRASGENIRAEHKGYVLDKPVGEIHRKIVCRHSKDAVTDEFYAIVDNGGKVLDVQVEHKIYGIISAELSIASRYDADQFVKAVGSTGATQLADLTGDVHIHTVSVRDEDTFERICERLRALDILVSD